MDTGSELNSPIEPTQVWTAEEWREQQPWGSMPQGDLRRFFKQEGFLHIYSAGPKKFRDLYTNYGSVTGRFKPNNPPFQFPRSRDFGI
jgi:hypothetical protein